MASSDVDYKSVPRLKRWAKNVFDIVFVVLIVVAAKTAIAAADSQTRLMRMEAPPKSVQG